jgi:hypothetical protein
LTENQDGEDIRVGRSTQYFTYNHQKLRFFKNSFFVCCTQRYLYFQIERFGKYCNGATVQDGDYFQKIALNQRLNSFPFCKIVCSRKYSCFMAKIVTQGINPKCWPKNNMA